MKIKCDGVSEIVNIVSGTQEALSDLFVMVIILTIMIPLLIVDSVKRILSLQL